MLSKISWIVKLQTRIGKKYKLYVEPAVKLVIYEYSFIVFMISRRIWN